MSNRRVDFSQLGNMNLQDLMRLRNKKVSQAAQLKTKVESKTRSIRDMIQMNKDIQNIRDKFFESTPLSEINDVIYPYQFQTGLIEIQPDDVGISKISITSEASFVITRMQRVVFETTGGGLTFIDPDDHTVAGDIDGLSYEIIDLSSERRFMDRPVSLSSLGTAQFPTRLEDPHLLEANQSLEVRYSNLTQTKTYAASILFSGYRLRIDDMNHLIQKVTY